MITAMQAGDGKSRLCYFPHRRNRVRRIGGHIDDDVDQPAMSFKVERCPLVLALEPRPVTKLNRELLAVKLPLPFLDMFKIPRVIGNPGRELEVDSNEFAGALEGLYSFPIFAATSRP